MQVHPNSPSTGTGTPRAFDRGAAKCCFVMSVPQTVLILIGMQLNLFVMCAPQTVLILIGMQRNLLRNVCSAKHTNFDRDAAKCCFVMYVPQTLLIVIGMLRNLLRYVCSTNLTKFDRDAAKPAT